MAANMDTVGTFEVAQALHKVCRSSVSLQAMMLMMTLFALLYHSTRLSPVFINTTASMSGDSLSLTTKIFLT